MKWVSCSLIRIMGHPTPVITCSNKKCVIVSTLQSLTGVAFSHLVKYYVALMMYLSVDIPFCGLIGLTKSIAHFLNTLYGVLGASHPSCWDFQLFDKHHSYGNIPLHIYELLATINLSGSLSFIVSSSYTLMSFSYNHGLFMFQYTPSQNVICTQLI
jgi:hypothetical protein